MLIEYVGCVNFMVPGVASLDLPARGVVVLTGPNGAGKSRFIEGAAYAISGQTLRGSSPWISGLDGEVWLRRARKPVIEQIIKRRCTAKGTKSLVVDGAKADTPSKTQELIGVDLDLWRRTHVFSSSDAAVFSRATDSERKELIESILGLEAFDVGMAAAAEARKATVGQRIAAQSELNNLRTSLASVEYKLDLVRAPALLDDEPAPVPPALAEPRDLVGLRESLQLLRASRDEAFQGVYSRGVPPDLFEAKTRAYAALEKAKAHVAAAEAGECGECGTVLDVTYQEHSSELLEAAELFVRAADEALELDAQDRERAVRQARERVAALDEQLGSGNSVLVRGEALAGAWSQYRTQLEGWEMRQERRRRAYAEALLTAADERARGQLAVDEYRDLVRDQEALVAELARDQAELDVAGKLMRVVRGAVLSRALEGIEAVANAWLSRVAGPARVRLRPYTENKSGGVSDKIGLELVGVAGGAGYQGASGGERRRVDVAVLLALAEVAAGARGEPGGTLWLDEVFDAVDEEGRELVASALAELAKDRAVVVITHLEDLARRLPAVARYRVNAGQLESIL